MTNFNNHPEDIAVQYVERGAVRPFVSVIVPMLYNSGRMMHAIRTWLAQTYPHDRFELVVVSKKDRSDMEMEVRAMLRAHDVVVFDPTREYYTAMNSGGRAAKGDILIFAESHVTVEPDCLDEMIKYMEANPDIVGASTEVKGDNVGIMADMQVDMYANIDLKHLRDPDHWRKIATRMFSMRRSVYVAHGPFEDEYGIFSERAVSIRFKESGLKFGFCTNAVIRHFDLSSFAMLHTMTRNYVFGECKFRDLYPESLCNRYLGTPAVWLNRLGFEKCVGSYRAQALVKRFLFESGNLKTWMSAPDAALRLLGYLHITIFGCGLLIALSKVRSNILETFMNAVQTSSRSLYRTLFYYYWHVALSELFQLEWLAEHGTARSKENNVHVENRHYYPIADLESRQFAGFHLAEEHDGYKFRWSEPESVLLMCLEKTQSAGTLTIQLLPGFVSIEECQKIKALINGIELKQLGAHADGRVEFGVPASLLSTGGSEFLCLSSELKRFPGDSRRLSLPFVSVLFAVEASGENADEIAVRCVPQLAGVS